MAVVEEKGCLRCILTFKINKREKKKKQEHSYSKLQRKDESKQKEETKAIA